VGGAVVEPATSLSSLRTDKAAEDCTTDQLIGEAGPDRRAAIAAAPALTLAA
jgi:hypothetical protein